MDGAERTVRIQVAPGRDVFGAVPLSEAPRVDRLEHWVEKFKFDEALWAIEVAGEAAVEVAGGPAVKESGACAEAGGEAARAVGGHVMRLGWGWRAAGSGSGSGAYVLAYLLVWCSMVMVGGGEVVEDLSWR